MIKSRLNLQEVFFFIILIAATIGFFYVIKPFLTDVFLAIVLAILFKRPLAFFTRVFKGKKIRATAVTLLLVFFTIGIPVSFIVTMVSKEVAEIYGNIRGDEETREGTWAEEIQAYIDKIEEKAASVPALKEVIEDIDWNSLAVQAEEYIAKILEYIIGFIQNVGMLIIHFFIVLFLLFYLFMDGKKLVERIQYLIPLKDTEEQEMFAKLERVTDAIVLNTFMLGFIEGAFGGVLFALVGIQSPFFWGMLMTFLSIIPLVGANTILAPMGVFQLLTGNIATGVIILAVGCGSIIINQNIIRPRLDGHKSGMHPAIMFLASMGGLLLMGLTGFIAGPMITGLFLVMWDLFGKKYQRKLEEFNKG